MIQPRDEQGNFLEVPTVSSEEGYVTFLISEYECRVIGNRLHRAAERYEKLHEDVDCSLDQDCSYWASRFLKKCSLRKNNDDDYYNKGKKRHVDSNYNIKVKLTDYECWSLGNRLFEMGQRLEAQGDERIASETKWLGRRFHAETKQ